MAGIAEIWDTLQKAKERPEILQKQKEGVIRLYFDGSAQPGKGSAGAGWVIIVKEGEKVQKIQGSKRLVNKTNNEAEWIALLEGVKELGTLDLKEKQTIFIYGDSQLVINQLTGFFRINKENLLIYANETKKRLEIYQWIAKWIPREFNDEADQLARLTSMTKRGEGGDCIQFEKGIFS